MSGDGVRVSKLSVVLGDRKILDQIDFQAEPGKVTLVIGHNGSGKSTLLRALAGLVPFRAANVALPGDRRLGRGIALLQQDANLFLTKTALENISVGIAHRFRPSRAEAKEIAVRSLELFPQLEGMLAQPCSQLSGGLRQMVALLRSLLSPAKVLLLDEPTVGIASGLHHAVFGAVLRRTEQTGAATIVTEHNFETAASIVQRVYVLNDGKVRYAGDPGILSRRDELRELYL